MCLQLSIVTGKRRASLQHLSPLKIRVTPTQLPIPIVMYIMPCGHNHVYVIIMYTGEPPNKGCFETNINFAALSFVEELVLFFEVLEL